MDVESDQRPREPVSFLEHARRRPWRAALLVVVATFVTATLAALAFPWWPVAPNDAALTRSVASHVTPSFDESCTRTTDRRFECSLGTLDDYGESSAPTTYFSGRIDRRGCWKATKERRIFSKARDPDRLEGCVRSWHFLD